MIPVPPSSSITDTNAAGGGRAYTLREPLLQIVPAVVDVPHAGRCYPPSFVASARLSAQSLRRSEDAYVDLLFAEAVPLGAPLLSAEFPRAYLDVNREPYELDQRMFEERLPGFANTRSMRVAGGLGTIPRIVGEGHEIYSGKLRVQEAMERIETCYRPYHAALRTLVERTRNRLGSCVLVDAHSMPSTGLEQSGAAKSDIILGDRYGTSASAAVVDVAEAAFRSVGLNVTRNRPYAGGFITEHYGDPGSNVHALQIEVNRSLYMDEATLAPTDAFMAVRASISEALATCFAAWIDSLCVRRDAAE
ncbi:MAG: N-formylglutamate amidohydrolase [Beijerinckiaceae bacterium]